MLELLDPLSSSIFENFEVVLTKIGNGAAVDRRKHVDAHVIRFRAEGWTLVLTAPAETGHEDRGRDAEQDRLWTFDHDLQLTPLVKFEPAKLPD